MEDKYHFVVFVVHFAIFMCITFLSCFFFVHMRYLLFSVFLSFLSLSPACVPPQVLGEQLKAQTQVAAQARAQLQNAGGSNHSSSAATVFMSGENGGDAGNMDQKQAALRSLQDERDRLEGELSEALEKVGVHMCMLS